MLLNARKPRTTAILPAGPQQKSLATPTRNMSEERLDFIASRQGASGGAAFAPRMHTDICGDPRMHNPYGGTVKRLLGNSLCDSADDSPRGVAVTQRAISQLRALLELTTRAGPGDEPAFEPRAITGELRLFATTWHNPLPAIRLLAEFCRRPSDEALTGFTQWFAQYHPQKAAAYGQEMRDVWNHDSPERQAFRRLEAFPPLPVGGARRPEPCPGFYAAVEYAHYLRAALVPSGAGDKYLMKHYPTLKQKTQYLRKHILTNMQTIGKSMDDASMEVDRVGTLFSWLSALDTQTEVGKDAIDYITTILSGVMTDGSHLRGTSDIAGAQPESSIPVSRRLTPKIIIKLLHPDKVRSEAGPGDVHVEVAANKCFQLLELLKRKGTRKNWFVAVPFEFNVGPTRSPSMPSFDVSERASGPADVDTVRQHSEVLPIESLQPLR